MKLQTFTLRDIVFLAIIAAVLVVVGMLTVPLVLSVHIFGIRSLVTAPFFALIGTIALMKVRKPGALMISATLNGLVLLMMSPVMFLMHLVGSFCAEVLALLIGRSYEKAGTAQLAATLYIPLTLPFTIIFSMWLTGTSLDDLAGDPTMALLVVAGTIILSIIGGFIGGKVGKELQKAGKLI